MFRPCKAYFFSSNIINMITIKSYFYNRSIGIKYNAEKLKKVSPMYEKYGQPCVNTSKLSPILLVAIPIAIFIYLYLLFNRTQGTTQRKTQNKTQKEERE